MNLTSSSVTEAASHPRRLRIESQTKVDSRRYCVFCLIHFPIYARELKYNSKVTT